MESPCIFLLLIIMFNYDYNLINLITVGGEPREPNVELGPEPEDRRGGHVSTPEVTIRTDDVYLGGELTGHAARRGRILAAPPCEASLRRNSPRRRRRRIRRPPLPPRQPNGAEHTAARGRHVRVYGNHSRTSAAVFPLGSRSSPELHVGHVLVRGAVAERAEAAPRLGPPDPEFGSGSGFGFRFGFEHEPQVVLARPRWV